MNLTRVYLNEIGDAEWDRLIGQVPESTFLHTSGWLRYCGLMKGVVEQSSFLVFNDKKELLGIAPFGVTALDNGTHVGRFGGTPFPTPALANGSRSTRRKVLSGIGEIFQEFRSKHNLVSAHAMTSPLSQGFCAQSPGFFSEDLKMMSLGYLCHVDNTLLIDLNKSEEMLFSELSTYQRKHVRKSMKAGLNIGVYNKSSSAGDLEKFFDLFQKAHLTSSGQLTRPASTWEQMYKILVGGGASLFIVFLGDTPISYLYCGEYFRASFGWSQVNVEEFERSHSPRQFLEWSAIAYYQKNGFGYYEVGERFFGPQLLMVPTHKQISIADFKERFGGFYVPKMRWHTFYNDATRDQFLNESLTAFKAFVPPAPIQSEE